MRRSTAIVLTATSLFAWAVPGQGFAAEPRADATAPVSTTVLTPMAGIRLPGALDVQPSYQGQVSCDPVMRPGTSALGQLLVATYRVGNVGYQRNCSGGGASEHYDGRAIDWMVNANNPAQKAAGDAFAGWVSANNGANARRLGIQYVIWNRKMWRAYAPARGWAAYSGSSPHTDHVHISLTWDGAMKRTSWWSGRALTTPDAGPCRVYVGQPAPVYTGARTGVCPPAKAAPATTYSTWVIGQRNAQIATGQKLLGISADGAFGAGTRSAVMTYQRAARLPVTGALDAATWVSLVAAKGVNDSTGTTNPSGTTTPAPTGRPPAGVAPTASPSTNPTPTTAPRPSTATAPVIVTPLSAHKKTALRVGYSGAPVSALQRALGVRVSGRFDAATSRAVMTVQRRWGLAPSGRVDLRTWNRVELTRYPWLPYVNTRLQAGSRGPAVVAVQRLLKVSPTGVFDSATAYAVRQAKRRLGQPATGVVDAATWAAFVRL